MLAENREGWSLLPIFNLSAFPIRTDMLIYMYTSINAKLDGVEENQDG